MRTVDRTIHPPPPSRRMRHAAIAIVLLLAACTQPVRPPPPVAAPPPPPTGFTIAATMLDTWNAVGQLLVRTDGVTYNGRSQMLGLYDIDYRGERFLVVTRALQIDGSHGATRTDVRVALQDGKPDARPPAVALLELLHAQLPAELVRIAALPKPAPVVPKKKPKAKKRPPRH